MLNEYSFKPLKRRSKQQMRAQRVRGAESRIEMQAAKWTAEGAVKGRKAEYSAT